MDNPEKLATLGTQNTGRRQTNHTTQHRKLNRWATRPQQKPGLTQVQDTICLEFIYGRKHRQVGDA